MGEKSPTQKWDFIALLVFFSVGCGFQHRNILSYYAGCSVFLSAQLWATQDSTLHQWWIVCTCFHVIVVYKLLMFQLFVTVHCLWLGQLERTSGCADALVHLVQWTFTPVSGNMLLPGSPPCFALVPLLTLRSRIKQRFQGLQIQPDYCRRTVETSCLRFDPYPFWGGKRPPGLGSRHPWDSYRIPFGSRLSSNSHLPTGSSPRARYKLKRYLDEGCD